MKRKGKGQVAPKSTIAIDEARAFIEKHKPAKRLRITLRPPVSASHGEVGMVLDYVDHKPSNEKLYRGLNVAIEAPGTGERVVLHDNEWEEVC